MADPHRRTPRWSTRHRHRLWTANSRVVDGIALAQIGDGGYVTRRTRASRSATACSPKERFAERDLLAIQLDDRALFLQRWWRLLRDEAHARRRRRCAHSPTPRDTGQAVPAPMSVSYRLVRAWRLAVHARIADGLVAPAKVALGEDFAMPDLPQLEGVVVAAGHAAPAAPVAARASPLGCAVRRRRAGSARRTRQRRARLPNAPGANATPRDLPSTGRRLAARSQDARCACRSNRCPATRDMPRVQTPDIGASERMVVSPGHEADGIIHMPGGQSGHPLSPFWGAGHDDWVQGGRRRSCQDQHNTCCASCRHRTDAAPPATAPAASVSMLHRPAWSWTHMRLLGLLILGLLSAAVAIYAVAAYSLLPWEPVCCRR